MSMNERKATSNKKLELINKIVDFIKSPISVDDFSIIPHKELIKLIKELNLKYLELFFSYFKEVKSISGINEIIANNEYIWKILPEDELNDLIKLIKDYGIKEDILINEIINSLSIYFFYAEAIRIPKTPIFIKTKEALSFLNFYQKEQTKLKIKFRQFNSLIKINLFNFSDKNLKDFDKVPLPIFNLINYLKSPNKRIHNPATNFLIAKITDAAIESKIKNNFSDFTIPLIKDLKIKYPDFFQEIINLNTDYISNRAKEGRKFYSGKSQD